ncbi:hypothetical protein Pint_14209 [Pistacia integerrima]|uniref:Uncharacterized protein n=1 Tax=Pistacia integerrima TaxID=434235 RepID=A0ACC0YAF0_9ROSI|nr:hypothetical protein Pint_14209 [Pistacia integerrima]
MIASTCPLHQTASILLSNLNLSRPFDHLSKPRLTATSSSPSSLSVDRSRSNCNMEWLRRMGGGCVKDRRSKVLKVEADSGGEDVFSAAAKPPPEHLIVMVNGLVGSAADWRYASEQFVNKIPDKVIVHRSECNSSKLTFDGVDLMGERLADEVRRVVSHRPQVQKISFVAHSLGGLIARYAIGRLYENSPRLDPTGRRLYENSPRLDPTGISGDSPSEEQKKYSMQLLEQPCEARIAGLEPMNFITFATPHLGSRGNKQLPLLCGLPFLERRASQTAHLVAGRTGKHLFLNDRDNEKPPLLLQMVNDSDDLKFISALRAFKRRVAYANANYDHMVGWRTSSIRRQHELPKSNLLMTDEKYPHIVHIEQATVDNNNNKALSVVGEKPIDLEGMLNFFRRSFGESLGKSKMSKIVYFQVLLLSI